LYAFFNSDLIFFADILGHFHLGCIGFITLLCLHFLHCCLLGWY